MNYGGSRKTISSAYGNISGSRKQIFPYNATTTYSYRRYSVSSWIQYSYDLSYDDTSYSVLVSGFPYKSCYNSLSFDSSGGGFTLSGSNPDKPNASCTSSILEHCQDTFGGADVYYYKISNSIVAGGMAYCYWNITDFQGIAFNWCLYYAKPNGYGGSYTTVSNPSYVGYGYTNTRVRLGNPDIMDGGSDSEVLEDHYVNIPSYDGYYIMEV